MIKMNGEGDKDDKHGNDNDGAGGSSGEGVVPKFHPAEDRDLDEKEKQTEHRREGPGEFDEAAHPLVGRLRHESRDLEFADGFHIWQKIRADHQCEDVNRHKDSCADCEHHEQPLGYCRRFVDLQLDHRHLLRNGFFC